MKSMTTSKRSFGMRAFFQRIGYAMARFMYGRNGVDQLNRALAIAYLILFFGGYLLGSLWNMGGICGCLGFVLAIALSVLYDRKIAKKEEVLTITGYAAFKVLVPLACAICAVGILSRSNFMKQIATKLAVFGCAIVLVIPASVGVSNLIEKTYNSSIQSTIDLALETTEEIEEDAELSAAKEEEKKGNLFSELLSKVSDTVTVATDKIETVLNHYLEALAVLLVTSCVIPVLVLFFFVWLVKIILGVDIPTPKRDQWEGLRHP